MRRQSAFSPATTSIQSRFAKCPLLHIVVIRRRRSVLGAISLSLNPSHERRSRARQDPRDEMKSDRRIYAVAVLLLSGLVPAENLRPQPSFESVLLQAIEDLPNGGQVDLVPKVDGHVSVVTAFDPLLAFFRTTMPPPTSSRLFDSHSLQEKRHGESQHITTRPRSKEALGEVKSKKKRRPRKKLYGISKQKLDLTPVDQPPNTTVKKKNEFRVSSESDLTKKYRGEGNFRTRTVRPYIHIGGHEQSKAVRSRFVASPIVSHHIITTPRPFKILKSDLKRTKQIQVEPSPVLHEEEHNFRPPSRSLLSAEPIMEVNDPIALRPLPASLYNAPKFCKKCFKHWMEKAPGATDTELFEYCCVTGYNKRRLG
ncbi:hypothetical protein L596_021190 [Steinernema carpocapsae]|uniref:Uncharacterized protein n=2 Tax=Steinernema carpocapsae TaxID=34508 RepID=A0A4U5MVU6_STECR|nr:hypothetical protein L596_021190 [Steinernema carpocapsae]